MRCNFPNHDIPWDSQTNVGAFSLKLQRIWTDATPRNSRGQYNRCRVRNPAGLAEPEEVSNAHPCVDSRPAAGHRPHRGLRVASPEKLPSAAVLPDAARRPAAGYQRAGDGGQPVLLVTRT